MDSYNVIPFPHKPQQQEAAQQQWKQDITIL